MVVCVHFILDSKALYYPKKLQFSDFFFFFCVKGQCVWKLKLDSYRLLNEQKYNQLEKQLNQQVVIRFYDTILILLLRVSKKTELSRYFSSFYIVLCPITK